jgi:chromosome segregation ATPase
MRYASLALLLGVFLLAGSSLANADGDKHADGVSAAAAERAPCHRPRPVHRGCVPPHDPLAGKLEHLREMQADLAREIAKAQRDQEIAAEAKRDADAARDDAIAAKQNAERAGADAKKQADDEIAAAKRSASQALAAADQMRQAATGTMEEAKRKFDEAGKLMASANQLEKSLTKERADINGESGRVKDMRKQVEQQLIVAQRRIRGTQLLQDANAKLTAAALQKADADSARANAAERQAQNEIATQKAMQARSQALNDDLENQTKLLRTRWEKIFDGMRNLDPCKTGQYAEQKPGNSEQKPGS